MPLFILISNLGSTRNRSAQNPSTTQHRHGVSGHTTGYGSTRSCHLLGLTSKVALGGKWMASWQIATKRQMLDLLGKLTFVSCIVRPSRTSIHRMIRHRYTPVHGHAMDHWHILGSFLLFANNVVSCWQFKNWVAYPYLLLNIQ